MRGRVGLYGRPRSLTSRNRARPPTPRATIKVAPTEAWDVCTPVLLPEFTTDRFLNSPDDPVADVDDLVLCERFFEALVGEVVGK